MPEILETVTSALMPMELTGIQSVSNVVTNMNLVVPYVRAEEIFIEEWLQPDHAAVCINQPICRILIRENEFIECDLDLDSPESGVLKQLVKTGELLQIGQVIAEVT